jgi:glycerate 2-kinase
MFMGLKAAMKRNSDQLKAIFNAAIDAVNGKDSVTRAYHRSPFKKPDQIIAVGKAANDMALGALAIFGSVKTLVITKYNHSEQLLKANRAVTVIEAAHPIPDELSLRAGKAMIDVVSQMTQGTRLLLLVSGGASALAECLPQGMSLEQWQLLTDAMISSGQNITQINHKRKQLSLIKDGRLLQHFNGGEVTVLAISDVQGDDISTIGSGIGNINRTKAKAQVKLVATNKIARQAAQEAANRARYEVIVNQETLYKDVFQLSRELGEMLRNAAKGIYIFGGEPTIVLPDNPGNGGRNQSLALALALEIAGLDHITLLVAGTDGTDGPTDAAGAIVNGSTVDDSQKARLALSRADAGTYLRQRGAIYITGPTGTNVMDLVIAVVA